MTPEQALPGAVRISDDLYIHPGRNIRLERVGAEWSAYIGGPNALDGETICGVAATPDGAMAALKLNTMESYAAALRWYSLCKEAGNKAFEDLRLGLPELHSGTKSEIASLDRDVRAILPAAKLVRQNDQVRVYQDTAKNITCSVYSNNKTSLQVTTTGRNAKEALIALREVVDSVS